MISRKTLPEFPQTKKRERERGSVFKFETKVLRFHFIRRKKTSENCEVESSITKSKSHLSPFLAVSKHGKGVYIYIYFKKCTGSGPSGALTLGDQVFPNENHLKPHHTRKACLHGDVTS